jgi:pimeloyl-ACP methyl ester carboxylesterase
VILHGLLGSGSNWSGVASALADRFTVVLPDLSNHGLSPRVRAVGYRSMAQDVDRLLESLAIPECTLVGHSMGGKVAMQGAVMFPERVSRLVVVDIAPKRYKPVHLPLIDALRKLRLDSSMERRDIDRELSRIVARGEIRLFLLKNLQRGDDGQWHWLPGLDEIHASYPELAGAPYIEHACAVPALFVRGSRSPYVLEFDERLIMRLFPNARIETIEGAGHWVHVDAPAQFLQLLQAFLAPAAPAPGSGGG